MRPTAVEIAVMCALCVVVVLAAITLVRHTPAECTCPPRLEGYYARTTFIDYEGQDRDAWFYIDFHPSSGRFDDVPTELNEIVLETPHGIDYKYSISIPNNLRQANLETLSDRGATPYDLISFRSLTKRGGLVFVRGKVLSIQPVALKVADKNLQQEKQKELERWIRRRNHCNKHGSSWTKPVQR